MESNDTLEYDDLGVKKLARAIIERAVRDWCSVTGLTTIGRFGSKEAKELRISRRDLHNFSYSKGFTDPVLELRDFFLSDWFRFLAESLGVDVDCALRELGVIAK